MDDRRAVHVLLVEDNVTNIRSISAMLARLGHQVTVTETAEAGLRAFAAGSFDLVLMDWHLPLINGLEATTRLRVMEQAERRPRTPVVCVTARSLASDHQSCREAGMDELVRKPLGLEKLRDVIDRFTGSGPPAPDMAADVGDTLLEMLAADVGEEMAAELGAIFRAELPVRAGELTSAAASGDAARMHRVAHTLKSTSLLLGLATLGSLCARLEKATPADDDWSEVLALLPAEIRRVDAMLTARLAQRG